MKLKSFVLCSLTVTLIACGGNFNSVYRNFNIDEGNSAMVDIKQRAVIISKPDKTKNAIVCAEPSPDAMSAYAAQLAAELSIPDKVGASFAGASQESASYTGLRTQSIQLLRDALYRLCEGYLNDALSKEEFDILMRRYQKYMVALLGIEQLTGTVKVPPVTINTQSSAEAARSISQMRTELESIDAKIKELESDKITPDKDEQGNDKELTDKQQKTNTDIDAKISVLEADKKLINNGIENARGHTASGSATAEVHFSGQQIKRDDNHIQTVAKSVEKIVLEIINTDDMGQLCFSYYIGVSKKTRNPESIINEQCDMYFIRVNDNIDRSIKSKENMLNSILQSALPDKDKKELISKLIDSEGASTGIKSKINFVPLLPENN